MIFIVDLQVQIYFESGRSLVMAVITKRWH